MFYLTTHSTHFIYGYVATALGEGLLHYSYSAWPGWTNKLLTHFYRQDMFYLTTHSTHFIDGYVASALGEGLLHYSYSAWPG